MATITVNFNTPDSAFPATADGFDALWASLPANPTDFYYIAIGRSPKLVFNHGCNLNGKTLTAPGQITIGPVKGQGFNENANVLTNAYRYNAANGSAIELSAGYQYVFNIDCDYLRITGLQLNAPGVGYDDSGGGLKIYQNNPNARFDNLIIRTGASGYYVNGVEIGSGMLQNILVQTEGNNGGAVNFSYYSTVVADGITAIHLGGSVPHSAFTTNIDPGVRVQNSAAFGYANFTNDKYKLVGSNNASDSVVGFGSNNKDNLVLADQFVNVASRDTADYRLLNTSALVDTGTVPTAGNTATVSGARQQGVAADIGSWEYPSVIQSPTAVISSITVKGSKVTISGTTTGAPTDGSITLLRDSAIAYNSAEDTAAASISFSSNAFSCEIPSAKWGKYKIVGSVSNRNFTANVASGEAGLVVELVGPRAGSLTQDAVDGEFVHVYGTMLGTPTAGEILWPALSDSAVDKVQALTLNGDSYDSLVRLAPGGYGPGILRFSNSNGTSLPQAGTRAVYINGVSGNPVAPGSDTEVPASEVTGVVLNPKTVTGPTQMSWVVTGNNAPQSVLLTTTLGTISPEGAYVPPDQTYNEQRGEITAKSTVAPDFKDTVQVIIPAKAIPTVEEVLIDPEDVVLVAGAQQQFVAVAVGQNNPAQEFTYETESGSISADGLLNAPALPSTEERQFYVRARSKINPLKFGQARVVIHAVPPEEIPEPDPIVVVIAAGMAATTGYTVTVDNTAVDVPDTSVYPPPAQVKAGVRYGPTGTEFVGTWEPPTEGGGGGGGGEGPNLEEIVDAIWADPRALTLIAFLTYREK